jgi:single-stranded DNA-binding protein
MIDALIAGRLLAKPAAKKGASGKPFVTCRLSATAGNGEQVMCSCIAFDKTVGAALLAMDAGDSVALAGTLTPKAWTTKEGEARAGLDMVVHALLTPYHVTRRRKAAPPAKPQQDGMRIAELAYSTGDTL